MAVRPSSPKKANTREKGVFFQKQPKTFFEKGQH